MCLSVCLSLGDGPFYGFMELRCDCMCYSVPVMLGGYMLAAYNAF